MKPGDWKAIAAYRLWCIAGVAESEHEITFSLMTKQRFFATAAAIFLTISSVRLLCLA
ncbi:MAG: hypothetical protein PUP92_40125 [Rhizonema sp. PD38]|nr:hypothetical protein [Rhizonema sp. PD38]